MNILGFDDGEESYIQRKQSFNRELEDAGCFDGKNFVGSFQIAEMVFLPLTFGGFLELQIRNHPALVGNWPEAKEDTELLSKSLELVSCLCQRIWLEQEVINMLPPLDFLMAVKLSERIVAGALGCAQQIEAAISESRFAGKFGWWGAVVVVLVRDLKLSVSEAVNLPMTPSVVGRIIQTIENRSENE